MLPHMQLTGLVKLHCSAGHLAERQLWAVRAGHANSAIRPEIRALLRSSAISILALGVFAHLSA
jgi:hypothetical protein